MTAQSERGPVMVRGADERPRPVEGDWPHQYVVMLEEVDGTRRLPIWIGEFEGTALAVHLEKVQVARPLTFAFAAGLLQAAGARLREVYVNRLEADTFYAVAVVEGAGGIRMVDARPSDALNLALVAGVPIRVEPAVFAALAACDTPRSPEAWTAAGSEGAAEIVAELTAKWPGLRRASAAPGEPG